MKGVVAAALAAIIISSTTASAADIEVVAVVSRGAAATAPALRVAPPPPDAPPPTYPPGPCDATSGGFAPEPGHAPALFESIGASVWGQTIWVEHWGTLSGPQVIVIGQVHGNECSPALFVQAIRRNPPTDYGIWLIPTLNPDGHYLGSRRNANDVDLNADGYLQSQPETRALMALTARVQPVLTVHTHSPNGQAAWYGNRAYHGDDPWASGAALAATIAYRVAPRTGLHVTGAGKRSGDNWFLWQGQAAIWPRQETFLLELFAIHPREVPFAQPRPPTRTKQQVEQVCIEVLAAMDAVIG